MKKPLRLTHHEFAEFYSELCDAIYCDEVGLTPAGSFHHTSAEARRKAMVVVDRIADAGYLEYR